MRRQLGRIKRGALNRLAGSVMCVDTKDAAVALSFDDGPNEYTPKLLECLADHSVRASFFMLGEYAAAHPEMVDEVNRGGHDVANHSWSHPSFARTSFAECRSQIARTEVAIRYNRHRLFRPPFGHQSGLSYIAAKSFGLTIVGWNNIARDWHDDDSEILAQRVASQLTRGGIVLLHDHLHDAYDPSFVNRAPTIDAVDKLITRFKSTFEFVPVSTLLQRGRAVTEAWFNRGSDELLSKLVVTTH